VAPDWLVGLWRRKSISYSSGARDLTTCCYWGQTRHLYVDIRIPADRPLPATGRSFADYSLKGLQALANQRGFAGHILLQGDRCTWIRCIDYQPDTGRPDTGRLRCDGDVLYEVGEASSVVGDAYVEVYRREAHGRDRLIALRQAHGTGSDAGDARGAVLLIIGDRFLFARPRPTPLPPAETLSEVIEATGPDRSLIHTYLDCEISLGRIESDHESWTIDLSTIPFREGQRLFPVAVADVQREMLRLRSDAAIVYWRIIECNLPTDVVTRLFDAA
jgi:hypothetical protein